MSSGKAEVVSARGIVKAFPSAAGPVAVLNGVDLALRGGESLAVTGESGSGKSTLLHLIGGLDVTDGGALAVLGTDLRTADDRARAALRRERIGMIFQQFNLIPSLTVAANLAFQARLAGRHDPARVAALAGALGLSQLMGRYPEQLSGGQQQRVAIGRALAGQPPLVLADEPTGNLDEATGDAVAALMLDLVRQQDTTLVLVTHSLRLAALCDRQVHLHAGRLA
ncbi:ABC transporter ATP-binding protein [Paracoccus chinensis]|uniref:Putative ABC transport system ATP-binding protein n=1 Tax=Paracoccus chinensis TaxID=525640 RepID=A0A1G9L6M1_9RHOB|nr:ABC transporter ATP-binding protein [Paracoccus chinensis]SDL57215.1 putative ABC transport system ATP-binding protein [Paracoccus chinensis]